jgi:DNA polymerase-4
MFTNGTQHMNYQTIAKTILHLDADAFFASVEQGFTPPLQGKPVIIGNEKNHRGVVHTASYEAREFGVKTGMVLSEAQRLVPNAIFMKGNFDHYNAISRIFRRIYEDYTPTLEFTSLDDAFLDLTGTLNYHKTNPENIARQIQQRIFDAAKVTVSCGIATSKFIARIASGQNKPGGITIVKSGTERDFLDPLPVQELPGIGPTIRERMNQLGIYTVRQLKIIPSLMLVQLFGTNGEKFWEYANGIDAREVRQKPIPKQISRETGFEEDISDAEMIREVLQYLTERIGKKLREDTLICQTVTIKIEYSDRKHYIKARSLPSVTNCTKVIFSLVDQLYRETPFRRLRIRRAGLAVSKIQAKNWQGELFDDQTRQESLEAAVDKIRKRFGFTSVMPASMANLKKHYRMEKSGYILHAPSLTQ